VQNFFIFLAGEALVYIMMDDDGKKVPPKMRVIVVIHYVPWNQSCVRHVPAGCLIYSPIIETVKISETV
jgi:hypothetical protein